MWLFKMHRIVFKDLNSWLKYEMFLKPCQASGGDIKECTCSDDRQIQLCPSSPEIKLNFLAANLGGFSTIDPLRS